MYLSKLVWNHRSELLSGVLFTWYFFYQIKPSESEGRNSDPAVKQILLAMNEKQSFIIEDLDDYHVVIKADDEYRVRKELDIEVCFVCFANNHERILTDVVAREEHLQPGVEPYLRALWIRTFCFDHLDFRAQVIYPVSAVRVQPGAEHSKTRDFH